MATQLTWANAKTAYTDAGRGIAGARALHSSRSRRQRYYYSVLYLNNSVAVPPPVTILKRRNNRLAQFVGAYDSETA